MNERIINEFVLVLERLEQRVQNIEEVFAYGGIKHT
jgi:hypothetical protein